MPWGRYPDRVKPFRKWATDKVDKADITDRATGGSFRFRKRRRKKRKRRRTRGSMD